MSRHNWYGWKGYDSARTMTTSFGKKVLFACCCVSPTAKKRPQTTVFILRGKPTPPYFVRFRRNMLRMATDVLQQAQHSFGACCAMRDFAENAALAQYLSRALCVNHIAAFGTALILSVVCMVLQLSEMGHCGVQGEKSCITSVLLPLPYCPSAPLHRFVWLRFRRSHVLARSLPK